jgi:IS30 family transposase
MHCRVIFLKEKLIQTFLKRKIDADSIFSHETSGRKIKLWFLKIYMMMRKKSSWEGNQEKDEIYYK